MMRANAIQHVVWIIFEVVIRLFFGYRVRIRGNWLPRELRGPAILVSNHRSYFDHFFVTGSFPFVSPVWPIQFLVARRFFRWWNPISWVLWNGGCIPVDRTGLGVRSLADVLAKAEEFLKKGSVLLIFPEGRRVKEEDQRRGGRGAAYLALKLGLPVIPFFISGHENLTWGRVLTGRAKVTLQVGEPFHMSGDYRSDQEVVAATAQIMSVIGSLAA